jgi:hypothetical protein
MSQDALTLFEERLLGELSTVVAARAETAPPPTPVRNRRLVPLTAAAAATVAAVAGTVTVIGLTGGGATPAYAVERNSDGVRITIRDTDHLSGLSQLLTKVGLPAKFVPISPTCAEPQPATLPRPYLLRLADEGHGGWALDILGPPLPPGKTAYLGLQRQEDGGLIRAEIGDGPRTCFPYPPGYPSGAPH